MLSAENILTLSSSCDRLAVYTLNPRCSIPIEISKLQFESLDLDPKQIWKHNTLLGTTMSAAYN